MRSLVAFLLIPSSVVLPVLAVNPPVEADATPDAPEAVRVVELDLVDTTRATPAIGDYPGWPERDLLTTVYLPVDTEAAPMVLLAHGFDGHPRKFSDLAMFWANAGYVVAVPRFPVSNDEFPARDSEFVTERIADVGDQAHDVSFVIDGVLAANEDASSELSGRVDPDRIGLFGLSLGSLTVWLATYGDGATETRVDALIQSDGGYPGDTALLSNAPFPVFVAHSDVDPTFAPALVMSQFAALPPPKYLLVLHGAGHATVGENTVTAADEAYRVATTVFWERYLGGQPDEPFPDSIVIDGVTSFIEIPG